MIVCTAPEGVRGPSDVEVVDGYTMTVSWLPPSTHTGPLTMFIIRAYPNNSLDEQPVEHNITEFEIDAVSGFPKSQIGTFI